jgi:hypothetical protein
MVACVVINQQHNALYQQKQADNVTYKLRQNE